jgi:hypothetical protein
MAKSTCPKWPFGQIGQGGKRTKMGVYFIDFSYQKVHDFLSSVRTTFKSISSIFFKKLKPIFLLVFSN